MKTLEGHSGCVKSVQTVGAYTISGAVAFNGIPLVRCIYVASTSVTAIKDAFTDVPGDEHMSSLLLKDVVSISGMCTTSEYRLFAKDDSVIALLERSRVSW